MILDIAYAFLWIYAIIGGACIAVLAGIVLYAIAIMVFAFIQELASSIAHWATRERTSHIRSGGKTA